MIPDGASLMIGGFMAVGTPERLIDEIVRQNKRDLTVIANDTAAPGRGIGKLVDAKLVRKVIASHIGLNRETQRQMMAGELEVELVPQGTLIERIRAGGHGLGGVLTQTGIGTPVEDGKQRIAVDGKSYLLELALRADFALVQAFLADYLGNLSYALTARNFNPVIAMAADTVIVAPGRGIGKLVDAKLVRKVIASHIGLNRETQRQMMAGELEVELVPQGTLIERIRAGGHGLGGVLTQTGIGTPVEDGKQRIAVDGKSYLLELALRADFALVQAFLADYLGNLSYALTARNFNPVIAMAADTVIVCAEHIVPVGLISPDHVVTPAPVVDYLIANA